MWNPGKWEFPGGHAHAGENSLTVVVRVSVKKAVGVLQTLVIALGVGLGIWGAIILFEGYGNDNPGAKGQVG